MLDALVDVPPPPTARRIMGELVRRTAAERVEREAQRVVAVASAAHAPSIGFASGTRISRR